MSALRYFLVYILFLPISTYVLHLFTAVTIIVFKIVDYLIITFSFFFILIFFYFRNSVAVILAHSVHVLIPLFLCRFSRFDYCVLPPFFEIHHLIKDLSLFCFILKSTVLLVSISLFPQFLISSLLIILSIIIG